MSIFKFWQKPGNTPPLFQTPIFNRTTRDPFQRSMIIIASILVIIPGLFLWFGSPALLLDTHYSKQSGWLERCAYISLITGLEHIETGSRKFPRPDCPTFALLEVTLDDFLP